MLISLLHDTTCEQQNSSSSNPRLAGEAVNKQPFSEINNMPGAGWVWVLSVWKEAGLLCYVLRKDLRETAVWSVWKGLHFWKTGQTFRACQGMAVRNFVNVWRLFCAGSRMRSIYQKDEHLIDLLQREVQGQKRSPWVSSQRWLDPPEVLPWGRFHFRERSIVYILFWKQFCW